MPEKKRCGLGIPVLPRQQYTCQILLACQPFTPPLPCESLWCNAPGLLQLGSARFSTRAPFCCCVETGLCSFLLHNLHESKIRILLLIPSRMACLLCVVTGPSFCPTSKCWICPNRYYGFAMLCMRPSPGSQCSCVQPWCEGRACRDWISRWHFASGIPVQHFCIGTAFTSQPSAACGLLYAVLES